MGFIISNSNISHQLDTNRGFKNAMNIISFLKDGIVISDNVDLPNKELKKMWMDYCRILIRDNHTRYDIIYTNSYKSNKFKTITEYDIYDKSGKFIIGSITHSLEEAEAQAYIKIIGLYDFCNFSKQQIPKLKEVISMVPDYIFRRDIDDRHYDISYDLREIIKNKSLYRNWKLNTIGI